MNIRIAARAAAVAAGLAGAAAPAPAAVIVASENFDGGAVGVVAPLTTNRIDSQSPPGRMFGVRSRSSVVNGNGLPFSITDDSVVASAGNGLFPPDVQAIVGQNKTDNFFGEVDFDQVPAISGPSTAPAVAQIGFNVSGFTGLTISIDIGAIGDFESDDLYDFAYSLDGGAFLPLFSFRANEAVTRTYRPMDSGAIPVLSDPLFLVGSPTTFLDKTNPATGALDTFTGNVVGTGSVLTLRFTRGGGTSAIAEAFAFDNIVIRADDPVVPPVAAVPEPASLTLVGLGAAAVVGYRRRRAG